MSQAIDEQTLQARARQQAWATSHRRRARLLDRGSRTLTFVVVSLFALTYVFPIYWMVTTALKRPAASVSTVASVVVPCVESAKRILTCSKAPKLVPLTVTSEAGGPELALSEM